MLFKTTVSVQSLPVEKIVIGQRPHRFFCNCRFRRNTDNMERRENSRPKTGFWEHFVKTGKCVRAHTHTMVKNKRINHPGEE